MLRSMTGFGAATAEEPPYAVRVEVRAVNNKNIKFVTRLHERLVGMEPNVENILRRHISRGTVQTNVQVADSRGEAGYSIDTEVAKAYYRQLDAMQKQLGIHEPIGLGALLSLPGVLQKTANAPDAPAELWGLVESALCRACEDLVAMRETEGHHLWDDMVARTKVIEGMVAKIEERVPRMLDEYCDRLTKRLDQLLSKVGKEIKPEEIHREIALFTDKADISEELQRMRSHLVQLRNTPENGDPVGRKIEFIIQEMFREANTMGSKANDPESVHCVVNVKSELEKLREQAYNIE